MPDTRFSLIGKCVVYLVKMPDKVLRNLEKEMKALSKVRKAVKKRGSKRRKSARKESKAQAKARMKRVRSFRQ